MKELAKPVAIPRRTIYRLSVYHRCLERLGTQSSDCLSSDALAKIAGVKPAQLRKDLAYFGQLGKRGLGYDAGQLKAKLAEILRSTKLQPVVLIGVGNLGAALLGYQGFAKEGFEVVAAFDAEVSKARSVGVPVYAMTSLRPVIEEHEVKMAILAVPGHTAQDVCNQLVEAGIQAVLNFAPIILQVPHHVVVNNVNLAIELENLSYFIR